MKIMSLYGTQSPAERPPKRGYITTGDDAFKAIGYETARDIDLNRKGKSVLFLPVVSGVNKRASYGNDVEDFLFELNVPYTRLDVIDKNRKRIVRPTHSQLAGTVFALKSRYNEGIAAALYDDTVLEGVRMLNLYEHILAYQEAYGADERYGIDNILLVSFSDRSGITNISPLRTEDIVDREKALKELRSARKPARRMLKFLYDKFSKVPEYEEILKRALLL